MQQDLGHRPACLQVMRGELDAAEALTQYALICRQQASNLRCAAPGRAGQAVIHVLRIRGWRRQQDAALHWPAPSQLLTAPLPLVSAV